MSCWPGSGKGRGNVGIKLNGLVLKKGMEIKGRGQNDGGLFLVSALCTPPFLPPP